LKNPSELIIETKFLFVISGIINSSHKNGLFTFFHLLSPYSRYVAFSSWNKIAFLKSRDIIFSVFKNKPIY